MWEGGYMIGIESRDAEPLPSEQGTIEKVLSTFTREPRPESGLDCLICATFGVLTGEG